MSMLQLPAAAYQWRKFGGGMRPLLVSVEAVGEQCSAASKGTHRIGSRLLLQGSRSNENWRCRCT